MAMTNADVVALVGDVLFPLWEKERRALDRIDAWARWDHDDPSRPRASAADSEYRELVARAQAPWGKLIVSSMAQTLFVEGYRRPDSPDDASTWRYWQANAMDARQAAIYRAALTYGLSYGLTLPGKLNAEPMPVMRGVSPREMIAVYDDPAFDEWPQYALRVVKPMRRGDAYELTLYDNEQVIPLRRNGPRGEITVVEGGAEEHGSGVTPVVRYANELDLEGRSVGEIEPVIPLLGKIDQTSLDRLVVQRFASWIVRTISGMNKPSAEAEASAEKLRLRVEDILISTNPETKFDSLPATPLGGFIEAYESDVRVLSAVTQSPAHEMLGQMANLSADALAAARASQTAKADERKHSFGESHEQLLRLAAHQAGDAEAAADFQAQVQWADTQIRSMAQAADALGKLVTMLGVPPEVAWEKIPGFTQLDVERMKLIVERNDDLMQTLRQIIDGDQQETLPDAAAP